MTIDEAIENLKYDIEIDMYIRDIAPQLAEWLELLKWYQQGMEDIPSESGVLPKDVYHAGYEKAIDDFVNACKEDILCQTFGLHIKEIERIAEQLKAGEHR